LPDFSIEQEYNQPIIGIDEVGRGPLAGPVVCSACIFFNIKLTNEELIFIDDSKKLSEKKRTLAFKEIYKFKKENKIQFSLGMASVEEIDTYNILEATKISMRRAVKKLNQPHTQLIIDGKIDLLLKNYPSRGVIKGDQKSYSIAAASIIAKIHRDRYMQFLSNKYPSYHWSSNAGYGTKKHLEEIHNKGITIHHRKSFEPIKSLIHSK
jgi:ribonuclease HII